MTTPLPLRDYQIADLAFMMQTPKCCNLSDPGCGKTPSVCVYIQWVHETTNLPVVWVMPKSLLRKNVDELLRFSHIRRDQIAVVDGSDWKDQLARPGIVCYLMGPTRFRLSHQHLPRSGALVADEPHMYLKTNSSTTSKAFYAFMRHCPRYVGMTGSLISGRLDSCYPTIHIIEPRFYGSYRGFLNHHAVEDSFGNAVAWKNPQRVTEILSKFCIRRTFESVYGPEAKVIQTELCQMSPKQREAYNEFEANALLELEDSFLKGETGGVFAIRCRQIMSHPETFGIDPTTPTGKDERLLVHLEDHKQSGKPLVIYASLVPEQERIERLVRGMGMTVGLMNGNVTGKKRDAVEEGFRKGTVQVLVCSPPIASVGYNWSHVDTMVFTSLNYLDTDFQQAIRRGIRGVRETPLMVFVLEYEDSIDQRIFEIIKRKSQLAASVDSSREVYALSKS